MRVTIVCLLLLASCSNHSDFEKSVFNRALSDPAKAEAYFLEKIENGASVEEQAIYLYGMGLANEQLGNDLEAINDYLSAEALGFRKRWILK